MKKAVRGTVGLSLAVLVALTAGGPLEAQESQDIESRFSTDLDGWALDPSPGTTATIRWESSGGNPGGYLFRDFGDSDGVSVIVAPPKFLGNLSGFDGVVLSWDARLISSSGPVYDDGGNLAQPDYGTLMIAGGGDSATVDVVPGAPPSTWTTFSTPLTAGAFGVSQTRWNTILANVTSLKLSLEAIYGPEQEAVDNFRFALCTASTFAVPGHPVRLAHGSLPTGHEFLRRVHEAATLPKKRSLGDGG